MKEGVEGCRIRKRGEGINGADEEALERKGREDAEEEHRNAN